MRILVVNPFGGTEFYGRENLARVARPDTQFDMVDISQVYPLRHNQWLYMQYECMAGTIDHVLRAEKEGYDAAFISCYDDIALYECRELADIPVTATLESSALLAYQMGTGYGLLGVDEQACMLQKQHLHRYGLDGKLVSLRSFDIDASDLYPDRTEPARVAERVIEAARQAVKDGAEVILPGCTLASSVLTHDVEDPVKLVGAPVIDGMVAGFKLAEMWADLRKSGLPPVSRRGFFQFPPRDEFEKLRRFLGKEV